MHPRGWNHGHYGESACSSTATTRSIGESSQLFLGIKAGSGVLHGWLHVSMQANTRKARA